MEITTRQIMEQANQRYIARTGRSEMLTREHEYMLVQRWQEEDDESALEELVLAYWRLVAKMATKFRGYGLPMDEMLQQGNIGLLMAADRFETERGLRFSTYASWWVRSEMQDFVLRNWSIVRTGTTAAQKALFFNLRRLRAEHSKAVDGPLSPEATRAIAEELGVKRSAVIDMETRLRGADYSLNAGITENSDDEWLDLMADEGPSPEDQVEKILDGEVRSAALQRALDELTLRERRIITQRHLKEDKWTLAELGEELGVSKERIRQLECAALRKLRVAMVRKEL